MKRMAFAVVVLVGCCAAPARADTLPLIEGVPGTYTPGQLFTFQVRVPVLLDLNKYMVELVFSTGAPDPSLLAFPTAAAPAPGGRYVFPSNGNFAFEYTAEPGSSDVVLTFSDFTSPPVNTVPGTNDTLATVTVLPGAGQTGPITITVGGGTAFDFNTEFGSPPPPEPIVVQQAGGGTGNPVPAPPGAVLLGIGGLLLAGRRAVARRVTGFKTGAARRTSIAAACPR